MQPKIRLSTAEAADEAEQAEDERDNGEAVGCAALRPAAARRPATASRHAVAGVQVAACGPVRVATGCAGADGSSHGAASRGGALRGASSGVGAHVVPRCLDAGPAVPACEDGRGRCPVVSPPPPLCSSHLHPTGGSLSLPTLFWRVRVGRTSPPQRGCGWGGARRCHGELLTVVTTESYRAAWTSRRPRTSTRSAATTCRRGTSGPSSVRPAGGALPRPAELRDRAARRHGRRARRRPAVPARAGRAALDLRRPARVANRIANLLVDEHGIVPGNRVLLRGPNNPLLVACWFAVLKAGAVVVTTMPLLRPEELAPIDEIAVDRPLAV